MLWVMSMLRMRDIRDSKAAIAYFGTSDGYYAVDGSDLRREVGGAGADRLRLDKVEFEQFSRLLQGLDPNSGDQLTAKLVDGRLAGWDVTATIPKGVTIAIERGDSRVHDALWEAGRETMADLERLIATRERKGGAQENRETDNLIWYGFEHPETRPSKQDNMPDPDRHIHFVIPNLTWDAQEQQWKAIKFRPVMDLRKWLDRRFDMRLASKLADLGYSIETKYKAADGTKRYFSWDIAGMPQSLVKKFSRRTGEVEALAAELKVETATGKDKLGATSRQHKRTDTTLADYRRYWESRVTPDEARQVQEVIRDAMEGQNPPQPNTADKGVAFAVGHMFERQSVVKQKELEIAAYERCMGGAKPEQIGPEMQRQGILLKDGEATTRGVLAEESRIIQFAREGKGTMRPLRSGPREAQGGTVAAKHDTATLSPGQQAVSAAYGSECSRTGINGPKTGQTGPNLPVREHSLSPDQLRVVRHVLTSTDRVVLVRGAAGTGKTTTTKAIVAGIDRPFAMLAPSADASRGVLRREGFKDADTVATFLLSSDRQQAVKNGVIFVDEAGLLPIRDLSALTDVARQQNARIVLMGDPKQHKSVARHGNMFHVLQEYAGLPVAELRDIRRQKGQYREAVKAIDSGDLLKAHDLLDGLGYIRQVDHNKPLVDDYLAAANAGKSVLVVAPTHAEGDEITAEIRKRLKQEGKLGDDERGFGTLLPRNLTEAEREEALSEGDVAVFFRSAGSIKAGSRVEITGDNRGALRERAAKFAAFGRGSILLAPGDLLRTTASVKDTAGKRIDNGSFLTVTGFSEKGIEVRTANNNVRILPNDVGHIQHGYVSTSYAAQGKTVDVVLAAMGSESLPAINQEQFYVTASRGRERFTMYTDVAPAVLRDAIQKQDARKSATELMNDEIVKLDFKHIFYRRRLETYRRLRRNQEAGISQTKERERYYGR